MARTYLRYILRGYYTLLSLFANLLFKLSRLSGNAYSYIWYYLGYSWYDHRFDHLKGITNFYWQERGFTPLRYMTSKSTVLDIGCGDGVFSGLFYSSRAKQVDAFDLDPFAISHANRYYSRPNVKFFTSDAINDNWPGRKYHLVLAFAILEHFSPQNGHYFLSKVNNVLKPDGLFIGSTPIFAVRGNHNPEHANEFITASSLKRFLSRHFQQVEIFFSSWPEGRNECYFLCRHPNKQ